MSEAIIGFTIIAIGTSLPELAASCVAARKKNADIAVANVLGSNIFNVLLVLGVSSVIHPLAFSAILIRQCIGVMLISVLLWILVVKVQKNRLGRNSGLFLLLIYICYIGYLVTQGL